MKIPTRFVGALSALIVFTSANDGRAQLAGSGTPGDHAVYTLGSGATLLTGLGTSVVQPFTTGPVADTADSFNVTATDGVIEMTAGHHVVIYGGRYQNVAAARAATDNVIKVNGVAQPYGASASYSRDGNANNNFFRGGAILELAQSDTVEIETARTDNHSQTINQLNADLQLLKLDDGLSYVRLGVSADVAAIMGGANDGPVLVSYDVQDELDAGFAHTSGSAAVTLANPGHYLVFANTGIRSSGTANRQAITQSLKLNGVTLEDSSTQLYLRNAAVGDGAGGLVQLGATSLGMIIETTSANSVLEVEVERDNIASGALLALEAGRTGLSIVALPAYGEFIRLSGPSQDVNFGQADPETTLDLSETGSVNNSSFNYPGTGNDVTANKPGDYLFLASHYVGDFNGPLRPSVRQGFVTTPSGGVAANVIYGHGGSYNRDQQTGADRARDSGDWAGAILPLAFGDAVATGSSAYGGGGLLTANSVGLQALNIASISAPPLDPVVSVNNGLAVLVSSTGNPISAADLETIDADNTPDELTYTLLDEPTGGTLRLSGAALAASGTFTQEDINNGNLTFDAGAVEGSGFGFEFEVLDLGGSNEASAVFAIGVGIVTALTADTAATDEDTDVIAVNGGDSSVLDNDTGTELTVVSHDATSALGATVTIATDGTLNYEPLTSAAVQALDDGDMAIDSFDYTVTDFSGASASETVTVSITGLNDAPTVVGEVLQTGSRAVASANLLANDSDVDATDLLTMATFADEPIGSVTTGLGAVVTIGIDGSFTYDPCPSATLSQIAPGANMSETLDYEVSDGTAISTASVTVTVFGEYGAGSDVESVGAVGTINVEIFSNDTGNGAVGTATAGAAIELDAAGAGNTDGVWNNTGSGGSALSMENPGVGTILVASAPANAPVGISAYYDLSGTGSGDILPDVDSPAGVPYLYGGNFSTSSFSVEVAIRPDDLVGDSPLWTTGGNGTGSSLVLLDDQLILTIGNGSGVAQAVGTIPPNALAGGDYVHVLGTFDIGTDIASLYINNVLVDEGSGINISNGAAANITDWSGTDDGGIGRVSGTTGGDVNVAPFLGNFGTVDIPNNFAGASDRYDGEMALVRIYPSALTPAEVQANFEAIFGLVTTAFDIDSLADVAGVPFPEESDVITLSSGATVTVESDGSLTYDPNGAFGHVGLGLTEVDTFTYTLANGSLNKTATVKVTVNGTNPNPQINIASAQTNVSEGGVATFTLTSTAPVLADTDVTVSFSGAATSGSDYSGASTTVTIGGGSSSVDLDLTTIADGVFESIEDVVVTIEAVPASNVIGASSVASTLIDNIDAPPVYSIAAGGGLALEGNDATFTISSPTASADPVTVNLSQTGTANSVDGFFPPTTVTIPANATSADIAATIFDDGHTDAGETLGYTIDSVSVGSIGTASASTTILDGTASGLFLATFEGVTIAPSTGVNALAAANEGTQTGTIEGVPSANGTGEVPGVVAETGGDVKGDGFDNALRVDRPLSTEEGMVDAVFAEAMDLSASEGFIAFDYSSRRTAGNSQKDTHIIGYDSVGDISFRLIVSGNNTAGDPADERLMHVDALGTVTPLGNINTFANSGGNDEDDMTRVTLLLSPAGYQVAIDSEPIDGVPETISGVLPYAGAATQVTRMQFALAGSTDDNFNAGGLIDDICAAGVVGNVPPSIAADGTPLPNAGATALPTMFTGGSVTFSAATNTEVSVDDLDANGGIETVQLQSVGGFGTLSVTLAGGATVSAGSNGSADVTISGTIAALNATLAGGVTYTAGLVGGNETLRITADDAGNTGAPGSQSTFHDFTFLVTANPTVVVDQAASQSDPTTSATIEFTAVFSEAVDNFDPENVDFTGSTNPGSLTASISGGPITWTIGVSGAADCEEVVVSLPVGAANRAGTADPSEASISTDNSVLFIANLPPSATNLGQDLDRFGLSNVALDDIVVSDGNSSSIANRGATLATFNWVSPDANPVPGDPADHELGFSLDLRFTPTDNDIAVGTTAAVNIYETGGTSNGHGVYMIDGIPYFICKMNGVATTIPAGLLDTDWDSGVSDDVISIPLTDAPLAPGSPTAISIIFRLDDITYSTNGSAPQTLALANRGTRFNWSGDDTVSLSTLTGPGGLSNTRGNPYDDTADVQLENLATSADFWRASDADFLIKALGEEIITATMLILQSGAGALTTPGSATFIGDTWSITDTISNVNAALAAVEFVPNALTPDFVEIQALIDDGNEDGTFPEEGEINIILSEGIIQQWRLDNGYSADGSGPGEGNLDIVAPNALTNLENFALGFDAAASGDTGTLAIDVIGGSITSLGVPNVVQDPNDGLFYFQFTRRADYIDATLTLDHQFSGDLELWEVPAGSVPTVVASGIGDGGVAIEALRIELPAALPSGAEAFFGRLNITIAE